MPGKILRDPYLGFILRFACIFGILIAPWPGWNKLYGKYFRAISQITLNVGETKREIVLRPDVTPTRPNLDSKMTMSNRDLLGKDGRGLAATTELDTRSIGWIPTALTTALILATPIPWRRRGRSLLGGWVLVQCFILFSLYSWVWNNSSALSLVALSRFWQAAADDLNYTLLDQIGASFTVPVLIWVLVTFRLQDIDSVNRTMSLGGRANGKSQRAEKAASGAKPVSTPNQHKRHSEGHEGSQVFAGRLGSRD